LENEIAKEKELKNMDFCGDYCYETAKMKLSIDLLFLSFCFGLVGEVECFFYFIFHFILLIFLIFRVGHLFIIE